MTQIRVPYSLLIRADMDQGEQLCEAARSGDSDKLRALIETGADVSYFDGQGVTPLMHAAKHGRAPAVKVLLEAGAPWNALSPSNISAGDFALEAGHQDAFDILLNAGTPFAHLLASPSSAFCFTQVIQCVAYNNVLML